MIGLIMGIIAGFNLALFITLACIKYSVDAGSTTNELQDYGTLNILYTSKGMGTTEGEPDTSKALGMLESRSLEINEAYKKHQG